MNQERVFKILTAPHVSEKAAIAGEAANQHVFKVATDAKKEEIKASLCSLTKLVKHNREQNDWQLILNGETSFLTNPQHKIIFN